MAIQIGNNVVGSPPANTQANQPATTLRSVSKLPSTFRVELSAEEYMELGRPKPTPAAAEGADSIRLSQQAQYAVERKPNSSGRITDQDMAAEHAALASSLIRQQPVAAMRAQANVSAREVLQLLE